MRVLLLTLVSLFFITPAMADVSVRVGKGGVYVDLDKEEYHELRRYCRHRYNWDEYECRWFRKYRHRWDHWDHPRRHKKKGFFFNFDF